MRETTLSACRYSSHAPAVSVGLRLLALPGPTVSLGLPYRGRDRETETVERPGRAKPAMGGSNLCRLQRQDVHDAIDWLRAGDP